MAGKTKWVVAGGAAAFAIAPLAVLAGASADDPEIPGSGVVIDASVTQDPAEPENASDGAGSPDSSGAASTTAPATPKKLSGSFSAASPASPDSAASPASPDSTGSPASPVSAASPVTPASPASPD